MRHRLAHASAVASREHRLFACFSLRSPGASCVTDVVHNNRCSFRLVAIAWNTSNVCLRTHATANRGAVQRLPGVAELGESIHPSDSWNDSKDAVVFAGPDGTAGMKSKNQISKPSFISSCAVLAFVCGLLFHAAGCRSPRIFGWSPLGKLAGNTEATPIPDTPQSPEVQTAGGVEEKKSATTRWWATLRGKSEDVSKAKQHYQKADEFFQQAREAPDDQKKKLYNKAARFFRDAGEAAPGSGMEQDALFMRGEALFHAEDYTNARDTLETLQKDFPRNRHSDRAAARLFEISQYWIESSKAGKDPWYSVNLLDRKLPAYDIDGHAVKVLDQIRYDDPTGKLADDATMAAAMEHFRNGRYEEADEFLTDLRETFTDSDHMFDAHMMGIRCKLEVYAGPHYSGRALGAGRTTGETNDATLPKRASRKEDWWTKPAGDILARAAAEIEFHQAAKLAYRAKVNERQREYGAARGILSANSQGSLQDASGGRRPGSTPRGSRQARQADPLPQLHD